MRHRRIRRFRQRQGKPWGRRGWRPEPAAGSDGRPVGGSTIRHNGRVKFVGEFVDPLDPLPIGPVEPSQLFDLRRRLATIFALHRLSGAFSDREVEIMEDTFAGLSLTQMGYKQGISRQRVHQIVLSLAARSPFFRRLWRRKIEMDWEGNAEEIT